MQLIWLVFLLSSCGSGGSSGQSCKTVCECKPIVAEQPAGMCIDENKDGKPDDGSENCACTCVEVCTSNGGKSEGGQGNNDGDEGGESCGPDGC